MSVVYIALPIALLISIAFVVSFVWQVRTGQLDDLETPAMRMLFDDEARQTNSRYEALGDAAETDGVRHENESQARGLQ